MCWREFISSWAFCSSIVCHLYKCHVGVNACLIQMDNIGCWVHGKLPDVFCHVGITMSFIWHIIIYQTCEFARKIRKWHIKEIILYKILYRNLSNCLSVDKLYIIINLNFINYEKKCNVSMLGDSNHRGVCQF